MKARLVLCLILIAGILSLSACGGKKPDTVQIPDTVIVTILPEDLEFKKATPAPTEGGEEMTTPEPTGGEAKTATPAPTKGGEVLPTGAGENTVTPDPSQTPKEQESSDTSSDEVAGRLKPYDGEWHATDISLIDAENSQFVVYDPADCEAELSVKDGKIRFVFSCDGDRYSSEDIEDYVVVEGSLTDPEAKDAWFALGYSWSPKEKAYSVFFQPEGPDEICMLIYEVADSDVFTYYSITLKNNDE